MSRWAFFWKLVRHSFHGTLRTLEIGEAVVAMTVYVAGYFIPEWKKPLEVLFVVLFCLLVLTFFFGLFLAAYASNREMEEEKKRSADEFAREREGYEHRIAEMQGRLDSRMHRQEIKDGLNRFIEEGNSLMVTMCRSPEKPSPDEKQAVAVWAERALKFISVRLPGYESQFLSDAGFPPKMRTGNIERANLLIHTQ